MRIPIEWNLNITKTEFIKLFPNMPTYLFETKPASDKDLTDNYLVYKLWRLNNLYTIVNKWSQRIPFKPNHAQILVYYYYLQHPRLIILKSRQQGISTLWLIMYFDKCITEADVTAGLMAQGKREAAILLTRTKLLWDTLDQNIKNFLMLTTVKDNTEAVKFTNGSQILIGVSFRSQTLQALHISEFGKIANENPKRAEETKTGTLQAIAPGNAAIIESTAEGDNDFKEMWDDAEGVIPEERGPKDFLPVFLSWADDPDCLLGVPQKDTKESIEYFDEHENNGWTFTDEQKWWWIAQYRELKTKIYQEYPLTPEEAFRASRQGAYWHNAWKDFGIIGIHGTEIVEPHLYNPRLPLQGVMDLGVNDTNTVSLFQYYNKRRTIIWEYGNNNQGVKHYANKIKKFCTLIRAVPPTLFLPHDAKKRSQVDLVTAEDAYRAEGFSVIMLDRPLNKLEAINHVRGEIEAGNIEVDFDCPYCRAVFTNYSREWDDKLNQWKKEPKHDEWSHWADMIVYMTIASITDPYTKRYVESRRPRPAGFAV